MNKQIECMGKHPHTHIALAHFPFGGFVVATNGRGRKKDSCAKKCQMHYCQAWLSFVWPKYL